MKAMLSKHGTFAYHSRVNPRPVDWWGRPDDPSYSLLRDCFRGRANLVTRHKTETFVPNIGSPPVTKEVPYTALVAQCLSTSRLWTRLVYTPPLATRTRASSASMLVVLTATRRR